MKTQHTLLRLISQIPGARIVHDQPERMVVSLNELTMTDAQMDDAIGRIRAELPDGWTAEEEGGAILEITKSPMKTA